MLETGFELGHYRIIRSLGSGGMADVYEAEDVRLGRRLALKVLPPELTRSGDLIERFEKEVRAAAALSHPNIVTLFEFGHEPPYHYYTMQLLGGGDLRQKMRESMELTEVMKAIRGVAEAFNHAHKRGFVHRDVKPENIIYDEEGIPVLTDFGIAKAMDSQTRMTKTGMSVGTPRYISPEQIRGKDVDGRADLYALGCILYEMLSGEPPYDAPDTMAIVFKHVSEPIPMLPPQYAQLQPLLDSLMAKEPDDRCPDARALIQRIDELFPRDWTGQIQVMPATEPGPRSDTRPDGPDTLEPAARAAAAAPTVEVDNLPPPTGSAAAPDSGESEPAPGSLTAELMTPMPPSPASPDPAAAPAPQADTTATEDPVAPAPPTSTGQSTPQSRQRKGLWLAATGLGGVLIAAGIWSQLQPRPAEGPQAAAPALAAASPTPQADTSAGQSMTAATDTAAATSPRASAAPSIAPASELAAAAQPPAAAATPAPIQPTPQPVRAQASPRPTAAPPVRQAALATPRPATQPEPAALQRRRQEAAAQKLFEQGQKLQRQGEMKKAVASYEKVLASYPDTRAARPARTSLKALEERLEQRRREALAKRQLQRRQASARELLAAAEALENRDQLGAAKSKYAEVIAEYADLALAGTAQQRIAAIDAELARRASRQQPEPTPEPETEEDDAPPMIGF